MVSNFLWSPDTIVDTSNRKIIMFGRLIINIDGKLGVAHLIDNKLSFVLKYDDAGKICTVDRLLGQHVRSHARSAG